jgi:hypothetical protein
MNADRRESKYFEIQAPALRVQSILTVDVDAPASWLADLLPIVLTCSSAYIIPFEI